MIIFSTPSRGQQVLTPLGSEQTTSLLVVLIVVRRGDKPDGFPGRRGFCGNSVKEPLLCAHCIRETADKMAGSVRGKRNFLI